MMLLIVAALWCAVRASETGRTRWLLLAAAALGVAFNVKLFESVVPLPALLLLAALGLPGTTRRRALQLLAAAAVYVVDRAVLAVGDAALPRPRSTVRDRLDQRQRLERRLRVQRQRARLG